MNIKYRDPDGTIYENIRAAVIYRCGENSCGGCPLQGPVGATDMFCADWAEQFPVKAAKLMGLEII